MPTWSRYELRRDGMDGAPVATRSFRRLVVSDQATPDEVALALLLDTEGPIWDLSGILGRVLFGWLQGI